MHDLKAISRVSVMVVVSFILFGCFSKGPEGKRNHQSIRLHNSMVRKANQIEHRLNEIRSDSTINSDSISILGAALAQWRRDLVEVPGNDEHDHGADDHTHSDKEVPEVTEAQMLEIQIDLDERLSAIGTRIMNLKPDVNHAEHHH
jgi:hypothetical protein